MKKKAKKEKNKNTLFTNPGIFVCRDATEVLLHYSHFADLVFLDPPYDNITLIRESISITLSRRSIRKKRNAIVCFMWLDDVPLVFNKLIYEDFSIGKKVFAHPEKINLWKKPESTKNTNKNYSKFLEAICVWHGNYFNKDLYWSNRTGIFVDQFIEKPDFIHKKPPSLVERIVKLHTPSGGMVLDSFAGTGTTKDVCDSCGFLSLSSDIDPKGKLVLYKD